MAASGAAFEHLLKRDSVPAFVALLALTALAWIVLVFMAADMGEPTQAIVAWSPGYFAAMCAMWMVMMAGMMIPSATPAILLFSALRRHAGASASRDTALFAAGYLVAWSAFSLVATALQWALTETALLSGALASEGGTLAGALFIVAGAYQFSTLKTACLMKCRAPASFLVEHRRDGALGPLVMGMHHGLHCVGCCGPLMALLFAFGVMNLLWVAALSAFVFGEKLFPDGRRFGRIGGAVMVGLGLLLLNV
jgi:predicted metal-binding membrane protein